MRYKVWHSSALVKLSMVFSAKQAIRTNNAAASFTDARVRPHMCYIWACGQSAADCQLCGAAMGSASSHKRGPIHLLQ